MAEDRRGSRPPSGRGGGPRRSSGSGQSGRSDEQKRGSQSGRPGQASRGGSQGDRRTGGKPAAAGDRRSGGKPQGQGDRRFGGKPAGAGRTSGPGRREGDETRERREPIRKEIRNVSAATYDGPPLGDEIVASELDRAITAQLKGLPEKLAARVARHLVAAGRLIDDDPETAYQHTLAAKARASRIGVVREAVGEAAYAAGHYAEALAELRAAKRINGATAYLPIMADCLRAVGRPQEALKLARSPGVKNFQPAAKAEMTLVEAGARRDMGQIEAALATLEAAPLASRSRESWVVRLRYAYADTLLAAGRERDALAWFHRTQAVDSDEITDAAERADELERRSE